MQLLGYIKKDKQGDALVEKLCQRFGATEDRAQWHNIAFCLTQVGCCTRSSRARWLGVDCAGRRERVRGGESTPHPNARMHPHPSTHPPTLPPPTPCSSRSATRG